MFPKSLISELSQAIANVYYTRNLCRRHPTPVDNNSWIRVYLSVLV